MRSRRNLRDEIDASTLRLIRSRTRETGARRVGSAIGPGRSALSLPVDAWRRNVTTSAIVSADRWAPRGSRPLVRRHGVRIRFNVGLSQRTRGGPAAVSPRELGYFITRLRTGQHDRFGVDATRRTGRIAQLFGSEKRGDGGDEGTRTPDPLLAKEVLSQLSYIPTAGASYPSLVPPVKALSETRWCGGRGAGRGARRASGPRARGRCTRRRGRRAPFRRRCARGRPARLPAR